jgi:hypothetical protein
MSLAGIAERVSSVRIPLAAAACCALLAAGSGAAQAQQGGVRPGFGGSLGMIFDNAADDAAFQLQLEMPLQFFPGFDLGPWIGLGFTEDYTRVSAALLARYGLQLTGNLERFHPVFQGVIGLSYLDEDFRDETGFLIGAGFGVEYELDRNWSLASDVLFNWVPSFRSSREFHFSWQLLGLRYRF